MTHQILPNCRNAGMPECGKIRISYPSEEQAHHKGRPPQNHLPDRKKWLEPLYSCHSQPEHIYSSSEISEHISGYSGVLEGA